MRKDTTSLLKNESGATAIEYALIASIVSIAIATVVVTLGDTLRDTFQNITDSFV